jgi:hypothetical protein
MNQENVMDSDNKEGLEWLDITLFFGNQLINVFFEGPPSPAEQREERRRKRIGKLISLMRLSEDMQARCKHLAAVVAAWFCNLPENKQEQFHRNLLLAMRQFNYIKKRDLRSKAEALLKSNHAEPVLDLTENGLAFTTFSHDEQNWMVATLLTPFIAFIQSDPPSIHLCDWCGAPYRTKRADTRFCSPTCRSNGRHLDREENE